MYCESLKLIAQVFDRTCGMHQCVKCTASHGLQSQKVKSLSSPPLVFLLLFHAYWHVSYLVAIARALNLRLVYVLPIRLNGGSQFTDKHQACIGHPATIGVSPAPPLPICEGAP